MSPDHPTEPTSNESLASGLAEPKPVPVDPLFGGFAAADANALLARLREGRLGDLNEAIRDIASESARPLAA